MAAASFVTQTGSLCVLQGFPEQKRYNGKVVKVVDFFMDRGIYKVRPVVESKSTSPKLGELPALFSVQPKHLAAIPTAAPPAIETRKAPTSRRAPLVRASFNLAKEASIRKQLFLEDKVSQFQQQDESCSSTEEEEDDLQSASIWKPRAAPAPFHSGRSPTPRSCPLTMRKQLSKSNHGMSTLRQHAPPPPPPPGSAEHAALVRHSWHVPSRQRSGGFDDSWHVPSEHHHGDNNDSFFFAEFENNGNMNRPKSSKRLAPRSCPSNSSSDHLHESLSSSLRSSTVSLAEFLPSAPDSPSTSSLDDDSECSDRALMMVAAAAMARKKMLGTKKKHQTGKLSAFLTISNDKGTAVPAELRSHEATCKTDEQRQHRPCGSPAA